MRAQEILNTAFNDAVEKYGDPTNWDLGFVSPYGNHQDFLNSQKMYNALKDTIVISKSCAGGTGCFTNNSSRRTDGQSAANIDAESHRYKIITKEGISMAFHAYNANCAANSYIGEIISGFGYCGHVMIDVDGPNSGENTWGKDLFDFRLTKEGFVPDGSSSYSLDNFRHCQETGEWCTGYAIEKCNRNYLH